MNELQLSNNIQQIEFEINYHKQVAGQSIWEIGRRLNHVKENDLAHGEFGRWLEKIGMNHREANKMMKVANEIPNSSTFTNLGDTALYLISTLPEEEREREHVTSKGETKTVDEMTVREIQELKKRLKDQEAETTRNAQKVRELTIQNQKLKEKEPKVIEKEIVKEVKPFDYDGLKSDNNQLSRTLKEVTKKNEQLSSQLKELYEKREEVDEKSKRYDQLNEEINKMNGRLSKGQQQLKAQKEVYDLVRAGRETIEKLAPLSYLVDTENVLNNGYARKPIEQLVEQLEDITSRLNRTLENKTIIEG